MTLYRAIDPDVYCRECGSTLFENATCTGCLSVTDDAEMQELVDAGAVEVA